MHVGCARRRKATGATLETGKQALFARHPQMAHWPASHGFTVYELVVTDIWMIDFYGGGSQVTPEMSFQSPETACHIQNLPRDWRCDERMKKKHCGIH